MRRRREKPSLPAKTTSRPSAPTFEPLSLGSGNSSSESWRRECEARAVLSWPLEKKREFLKAVEKHRGQQAAEMLKADMGLIWMMRKTK